MSDELRIKNLPENNKDVAVKVQNEGAEGVKTSKKHEKNLAFREMWANAFFRKKTSSAATEEIKEKQKAPAPYVYLRVTFMFFVLFIVTISAFYFIGAHTLYPIILAIVTTFIPVISVVFFYEMDTSRRISLYTVLFLFFLSVAVALTIDVISSLLIYNKNGSISYFGGMAIGLMESVTIFTLSVSVVARKRIKDIISGLLIGAIIGAGFAVENSLDECFAASFVNTHYASNIQIVVNDDTLVDSLLSVLDIGFSECILHAAHYIMTGCVFAGVFTNAGRISFKSKTINFLTLALFVAGVLFCSLWMMSFSSQLFVIILRIVMVISSIIAVYQTVRVGLSKNTYE